MVTMLISALAFAILLLQDVMPGSVAPKLEIKEWVKGSPIQKFEADQTYVIEFWATWCGPCLESIPHITDLAKKYPNIRFVGVSIWEDNDKKQVQKFVEKMGSKMDYSVAYSSNKEGMARTWLEAAKQPGIPASFIVKGGIIQWIGSPLGIETPLIELVNGTFDIERAKLKFVANRKRYEENLQFQKELAKCKELYNAGDRKSARELANKLGDRPEISELKSAWLCIESPDEWKKTMVEKMDASQDHGTSLCYFMVENTKRAESQCMWLLSQLEARFSDNWYVGLCAARMFRQLKQYEKGLEYAKKSRGAILEFRRQNPDVPEGNALDVIAEVEKQINLEMKGG